MDLWRISNHASLNGEGGRRVPARWHSSGVPIVYLAACPPGALLEALIHLELGAATLPPTYTLLQVTAPDNLPIDRLDPPADKDWIAHPVVTQQLGDTWLSEGKAALCRVPSAIMPHAFNYLLNRSTLTPQPCTSPVPPEPSMTRACSRPRVSASPPPPSSSAPRTRIRIDSRKPLSPPNLIGRPSHLSLQHRRTHLVAMRISSLKILLQASGRKYTKRKEASFLPQTSAAGKTPLS